MERPDQAWEANDIATIDGGGTCTIASEVKTRADGWEAERAFVVSGRRRELLPLPALYKANPIPFGRFAFAPGEGALLADRKLGSGLNQVFLFRRISGLRYRLTDNKPLNERVVEQFGRPPQSPGKDPVEFILLQCWLPTGEALLSCHYGERSSHVYSTIVLEPRTGYIRRGMRTREGQILPWPEEFERYPQTRLRPMTSREIASWDYAQLRYAINEMYGRRGYGFKDQPEIRAWFVKLGFYTDLKAKKEMVERLMWPTERLNLQLLAHHRDALKRQGKTR